MTPRELLEREPELVDKVVQGCDAACYPGWAINGVYYAHCPEIQDLRIRQEKNERVEVRWYKYFDFDGRRIWALGAVYFDDRPVMIVQNAGREGDDHRCRYMLDFEAYKEMVLYLFSISEPDEPDLENRTGDDYRISSMDEEVEGLDSFYGNNLDGHFER